MTEEIETQIIRLSSMVDGINIALERAKEIREKEFFLGEDDTIGLDGLISILRKDKIELVSSMKELQKRL